MKWCVPVLAFFFALALGARACGPGRGAGRRRGPRKLTPLVFKQHVPNVPENTITASGLGEGRIGRNDTRFRDLVPNYNQDIIFKDEEGTGADRLMTQRCKEKLNTLAISVMNQWPGVHLVVTEGWDEEGYHTPDSLHYEGRAVDLTTSDKDRSKYGMLARLAVEAGFDWVYYESRAHIHCSVKSESSQAAKYGGCFSAETTVLTSEGITKRLPDLKIGEKILSLDPSTFQLTFSDVLLFLHYDPEEIRQFVMITLKSGKTLTVTPTHLVLSGSLKTNRIVYAGDLRPSDIMLTSDSKNGLQEDVIVEIEQVLRKGLYAPLTEAGTVVVNDVLASCYAVVNSQALAHLAYGPLRLIHNMKEGLRKLWSLISRPITGWNTSRSFIKPTIGVHWYGKMLYSLVDIFYPKILQ
ncbi:tiggy-winkle hedgehog protein [Coccinella septempunctata]|uniref:tiggy-winkle hedgehog protein n=1 Tax=Coccinella septempunctata TaxID=41139 RepID=UPI001D07C149|nr:tiggy-winkle hedgehog protein [Coccinella septempunctata]